MSDATDALLAQQYEALPYPPRDPRDETKNLIVGSPGHLREIDHWIFGACRPANKPLNALIAGGGTGDATIMLAQQLATAGRPGRVTWLDRSSASLRIAQARAAARRLDNIDWEQRSLLDLPRSGLGPFDYVDCCGVLHHLPDPAEGLRALLSVLAPGGGLGLMVYAPHGRTGVYMVQDALRLLAPPDQPIAARLDAARRVLRHLPETAWFRLNQHLQDHIIGGDAGVFDLLLNPRDRAFSVPELAALVDGAGLEIVCWVEPVRYDPLLLLPDPRLRARAEVLPPLAQAALAEALAGNMSVHVIYCVRKGDAPARADPMNSDVVPTAREGVGADIARFIQPDGTMTMVIDGLRLPQPVPPMAAAILNLIDGRRPLGDIEATLTARGTGREAFVRAWGTMFAALEKSNRLLLAAPC
ncbi:MAG: class I SAM-dependent methyltransferase [Acetobacteraceae bacterium]